MLDKKEIEFEFERQMRIYKELIKEGEEYERIYRWEQSFNIYLNAEKIVKKYGSKNEISNIFYRKGRVLARKGNLKEALNAFKDSLKFLKKGGGMPLQFAEVNSAIGDAYKINGNIKEALESYKEALKILQDEKERVIYTHSHLTIKILEAIAEQLNNIAEMYLFLEDWDKALENSRESLKVALDTKTNTIILKSRLAISRIYAEKGDNKTALEYLMKSIKLAETDKNEEDLLKIYLEIVNISKKEEDNKLLLDFNKKSLNLAKKLGNKTIITKILAETGAEYLRKNNKKKALEFLEKSYELGNEINQFYFEYILYYLGDLHYSNKNYDTAYENFKESLEFAKKTNKTDLILNNLIKIGEIWKIKGNFDDSIYYYKKAEEYTNKIQEKIRILNEIGLLFLLSDNLTEANYYFLRSFNELRVLILLEPNLDKKIHLSNKFSDVVLNLCVLKCISFEKLKNIELIKEAIGFSEFINSQNIPIELKNDFEMIHCPERKKILDRINEKSSILKNLNYQYYCEQNSKVKDKLFNQIDEIKNEILKLDETIWETCDRPVENFPLSVQKIVDKFFQTLDVYSESWVILDLVFNDNFNTLFIFLIDLQKRDLQLFSKILSKTLIKSIYSKLNQIEKLKINGTQTTPDTIYKSLITLWDKMVPKELTKLLLQEKYNSITFIPHAFLWSLPWESMQINKRCFKDIFQCSQVSTFYYFLYHAISKTLAKIK